MTGSGRGGNGGGKGVGCVVGREEGGGGGERRVGIGRGTVIYILYQKKNLRE